MVNMSCLRDVVWSKGLEIRKISLICMHLLAIYKERLYDLYVKNLNTVQIYDTMYVHTYRYYRYNVYIYIYVYILNLDTLNA